MPTPPDYTGTLLLIDDERMLLDMVAMACSAIGFFALKAANGADALALIDQHPEIGLVMTDISLTPEMDGFRLAHEIRLRRPEMPVIFFSGHGSNVYRPEEFATAKVLGKPVPLERLRLEIRKAYLSQPG